MAGGCRGPEGRVEVDLEEAGYGTSPEDFHRAAEIGDLAVMGRMLDGGMAVDVPSARGDTALHAAAAAGSVSAVGYLLERGMGVDVRGAANRTPLMTAAEVNAGEVCAVLLREGARPELTDNNGYRAITLAADRGHSETIRKLAVHSREYLDDALLLASLRGYGEAAGVLADYGASVYARLDDGLTPLMLAAREGHGETVRILLEHGANRYAVDFEGRTAGQIASEARHVSLAAALNSVPGQDAFSLADVPELASVRELEDGGGPGESAAGESVVGAVVGAIIGHQEGEGGDEVVIGAAVGGGEGGMAGEGVDLERSGEPLTGGPVGEATEELVRGTVEGGGAGIPDPRGDQEPRPKEAWEHEMLVGGADVAIDDLAREDGVGSEGATPAVGALVMESYREKPLPLRVEGVEGQEARVRYLFGENESVTVKKGDEIPFTGLRVVKVESRHDDTKMSMGRPVDVSTVVIEDPVSGRRRELVAKLDASAHEPFAVLRPRGGGEPMIALQGGVLRVPSGAMYVVQDVRPSQVVLENTATGEMHTVRAGRPSPR